MGLVRVKLLMVDIDVHEIKVTLVEIGESKRRNKVQHENDAAQTLVKNARS